MHEKQCMINGSKAITFQKLSTFLDEAINQRKYQLSTLQMKNV